MRLFVCIVLLLHSVPLWSQEPPRSSRPRDATQLLRLGLANYHQKAYREALEEFQAAYQINHNAQILFAIAQSLRKQGHCEEAIADYRDFIRAQPAPSQIARAAYHIESCEQELKEKDRNASPVIHSVSFMHEAPSAIAEPQELTPEPQRRSDLQQLLKPPAPKLVANAPPTRAKHGHWYRDRAGMTLAIGSGAALAISIPLWALGAARARGINAAPNYGSFARAQDGGQAVTMQYVGIGLLACAGILAIASTVRFALVKRHSGRDAGHSGSGIHF